MKPCCARFAISLSWFTPQTRPALSKMPLRVKIKNPEISSVGNYASMASTSQSPVPKELPSDEPDDVLFGSLYGVRTIELNRPKKLNSLNGSMARKILPRLREWEKSQMANIILMSGAGSKAFCAGGDVAELAKQNGTAEGQQSSRDYFQLEYQLDYLIATYSKPYIAIMDGITMGGGVGLSVHAPFRIATEKTVFAMPETTIGFFPDVGGSFFLPRLDGEIGTYLALTSERLHGVQAFYAGVATHYLDSSSLTSLTTRLSELLFKDYATLEDRFKLINATIAEFSSGLPAPDSYEGSKYGNLTGKLRAAIDRCFGFSRVDEIFRALESEAVSTKADAMQEWASSTLKSLQARSPTSLKVALRQMRLGGGWNIRETFSTEYRIASKFMSHPDFVEGVSARLIKPLREPKWNPATLEEVSNKDVDEFFLPQGRSLQLLPPAPGSPDMIYEDYPHANIALPRESEIRKAVEDHGKDGARRVVTKILEEWDMKEGVQEKVMEVLARNTSTRGKAITWGRGDM